MINLKKVSFKNHKCYYFDDITKFEDFNFGNILLGEKSYKNILVYDIYFMQNFDWCKTMAY